MDLLSLDGPALLLRRRGLPEEDTVEEGARMTAARKVEIVLVALIALNVLIFLARVA